MSLNKDRADVIKVLQDLIIDMDGNESDVWYTIESLTKVTNAALISNAADRIIKILLKTKD